MYNLNHFIWTSLVLYKKLVILTLIIDSIHFEPIIDTSHEYQSNEEIEKTHKYIIIGVAIGIIVMDNQQFVTAIWRDSNYKGNLLEGMYCKGIR